MTHRTRKPKRLLFHGFGDFDIFKSASGKIRLTSRDSWLSPREAKALHRWLGRAIAWMEEQRDRERKR